MAISKPPIASYWVISLELTMTTVKDNYLKHNGGFQGKMANKTAQSIKKYTNSILNFTKDLEGSEYEYFLIYSSLN